MLRPFLCFPLRPKIEKVALAARLSEDRRRELESLTAKLEIRVSERTVALTEAVEARDEFLSIASHELRTPITSLKMQLDILNISLKKGGSDRMDLTDVKSGVRTSLEQVGRLTRLIDDLLDISRIKSGQLTIEAAEMDLMDSARGVIEKLRFQAGDSGNQIELKGPEKLIGFWDRHRLEQVFVNLLSNALRYAPGAKVEVSIASTPKGARVAIVDFGSGIAPDRINSIFHRFERASSKNTGGLGLGLYIVNEIVKAHRGKIWAENNTSGGATFTMELPNDSRQGIAEEGP